jgi:hypothetical protein
VPHAQHKPYGYDEPDHYRHHDDHSKGTGSPSSILRGAAGSSHGVLIVQQLLSNFGASGSSSAVAEDALRSHVPACSAIVAILQRNSRSSAIVAAHSTAVCYNSIVLVRKCWANFGKSGS